MKWDDNWNERIDPEYLEEFKVFAMTGEDPEDRVLDYVDRDEVAEALLDEIFALHIAELHKLGEVLNEAAKLHSDLEDAKDRYHNRSGGG